MSKNTKAIILISIFAILVLSIFIKTGGEEFDIGDTPPDFKLQTLDGDYIILSELKGKVVIINFWGTWCPPCREEAPDIERFYREYKQRGLEILGINIDAGSKDEIKSFKKEFDITFPVLLDPDSKVGKLYGITGVPETIVLDKQGKIGLLRIIGPFDWNSSVFRMQIEKLLNAG